MKREDVLAIVKAHQLKLQELGVKSLELFGFSRIRLYLEDILGCPVDLGTQDALREHLREPVLEDVIRVF
ncbi:MAG: nucleotidyltransferase [Coleofasciculus chthonoplastes F3-SA18-01]|uniref:nucleotidyltransferase family protein n=1 Tax=Coleofasciculus chthonoplastes TaxID=64178 RepID=UPI0032FC629F